MKTILLVFGTRPEAIKMCPLVQKLKNEPSFRIVVCVTGQHRQMLYPVLEAFGVEPEYDLAVMKENQTLFDITGAVLQGVRVVLETEKPDLMLVHGDTTTAFAAALAAFYSGVPVGHVEAGLRTYDLQAPFPEEFNRRGVGLLARWHFAPTEAARDNLLREGVNPEQIYVTGNTVVDALQTTVRPDYRHPLLEWAAGSRLLVLTAHRRENLGEPLREIFSGVKQVLEENPDVKVLYPVHMNPAIRRTAEEILGQQERLRLTDPLEVVDFHNILSRAYLVLTDSGGIQEEAAALGKPVLVLRSTTERPEGLHSGSLRLAGTHRETIFRQCTALLGEKETYEAMSRAENPFGDGTACRKIAAILRETL